MLRWLIGIILGEIICKSSNWQHIQRLKITILGANWQPFRLERIAKCSYFILSTQNIKFYWFVMKIKKFLLPIWWYNRGPFPLGNKYLGSSFWIGDGTGCYMKVWAWHNPFNHTYHKYTLIFINLAYGLLHVPNSISANSDNINILKLIMFHPCWVTNSKVCFVVPYSHLRNSLFIIELIWTTRIEYRNVTSSKLFVCISAFSWPYFGRAWWKTSTHQIWHESVHGGPRYGHMNTYPIEISVNNWPGS